MDRRSFVLGAATLTLAPAIFSGESAAQVLPPARRVFVAHPDRVEQQCADWCWAACCSMIFATLGHPTDQKKLVNFVYEGTACAPIPQTGLLTRILNQPWIDDCGEKFQPQIEAGFDQENGIVTIDNALIIAELQQKRPLLYANQHHCMVVVEADYYMTPLGPQIASLGVADPWPATATPFRPPFHPLTEAELLPAFAGGEMMYLAAVRLEVTPV